MFKVIKNKKIIFGLSTIFIIVSIVFFKIKQNNQNKSKIAIGILQTASHPALNKARDAFIQKINEQFNDKFSFLIQNAEGSSLTAQSVAKSFHCNSNIKAIFSLGTLATQAISKIEKEKPIIFCAVTDPISLGIINPKSNVCGISDSIDILTAKDAIKMLFPKTKKVAMLFNPAEPNSVSIVKKMEQILKDSNFFTLQVGINNESEISPAVNIALQKADLLWIPTDNMLANAMGLLGKLALKAKKPLFICDNLLITEGILACAGGVDYTDCGKQAANVALEIIIGKKQPNQFSVINNPSKNIIINKKTWTALELQKIDNLSKTIILQN